MERVTSDSVGALITPPGIMNDEVRPLPAEDRVDLHRVLGQRHPGP